MSIEPIQYPAETDLEPRSVMRSMKRGVIGRCPSCGEGHLFSKGLLIADTCSACDEELHHHRADDLPAYLNIFIIGHVVVALAMFLQEADIVGMWTVVVIACIAALVLAVALMRPLKGMVVGVQWAMRMHGFGGHDD